PTARTVAGFAPPARRVAPPAPRTRTDSSAGRCLRRTNRGSSRPPGPTRCAADRGHVGSGRVSCGLRRDPSAQNVFEGSRNSQVGRPAPQVNLVEAAALHRENSGRITALAFRRSDAIPVKLVQNDIFGRGDPTILTENSILQSAAEHLS